MDFLDNVQGRVEDEGSEVAVGGGEVREAVAGGAGGTELMGEEGGVGGGEDGEVVGHGAGCREYGAGRWGSFGSRC